MIASDFEKRCIVAVIPCYRVEREIQSVLQEVPAYIKHIVVVDDASPELHAGSGHGVCQNRSTHPPDASPVQPWSRRRNDHGL